MSIKIKSILYLVENKTRDLDAILFFAKKILDINPNLRINVMPISKLKFKDLFDLDKSIIIWPHPRHFLINWSYLIGHLNIVHETEGIPYKPEHLFHSSTFFHNFSITQVWCWGKNQTKILKERFKDSFLSNKIITTGSIRYQFALEKQCFQTINHEKPRALITTNYNILNPRYQTLYKEMMDHKNNYKLVTSDPNIFLKWMISETERRLSFFTKIKQESNTFAQFEVEIRPHPFEALDYYKEDIIEPIDFKIQDYTIDISEAISNTQIVVATGCQTVLDSIINKKPVFGDIKANYNLWDKFVLPLDNLSNYKIDEESLKILAKEQFENSIRMGLGDWLNNLERDFDYSYLISLTNKKFNSQLYKKNITKLMFYLFKGFNLIPFIFRSLKNLFKENNENKIFKKVNLTDIINSKEKICPDLKLIKSNNKITLCSSIELE